MGAAIFTEWRVKCFLDSALSASVPRNFPRESLSERHIRRKFHAGVEYSPGICLSERTHNSWEVVFPCRAVGIGKYELRVCEKVNKFDQIGRLSNLVKSMCANQFSK